MSTSSVRNLALRMLAVEAASKSAIDAHLYLADDIVRMRYVSINGQWRKMVMVVKMRRSTHSIDMCEYAITDKGVVIGEPLRGYRALTSGIPGPWSFESEANDPNPQTRQPPDPPTPQKLGRRSQ